MAKNEQGTEKCKVVMNGVDFDDRESAQIRYPTQKRAQQTYDCILDAAGYLLEEIGIQDLSTNQICRRAGVTPPALYRYFSSKYAVLAALGMRLMASQNDVYLLWLRDDGTKSHLLTRDEQIDNLCRMQNAVNAVTHSSPGAAWIMRALRAVPSLQYLRLESHQKIAEESALQHSRYFSHVDIEDLRIATRLCTEVMYGATEVVADNPQLDAQKITREVAEMVVRYFEKFYQPPR